MTSLVQYRHDGKRGLALLAEDGSARAVLGADTLLALAQRSGVVAQRARHHPAAPLLSWHWKRV